MKIDRIEIDAFGKLEQYTLSLDKGFQVLYGGNEQGKTTLMTFLKLMFYSRLPRAQGLDQPRKRYAPWSGHRMGGAVEFTSGGETWRLQKEFGDTPGRDKVRLLRGGEVVPLRRDEEIGQRFFGLDVTGFERSSFIGQTGGIDAGKSDDVARRLMENLAQTGDETASAQETLQRLTDAKLKLVSKSGTKGRLAEARQQMQALREELAATEAQLREQRVLQEQYRAREAEMEQSRALEEKWKAAQAWQRAQRLDALLEKAAQLKQNISDIQRPDLSLREAAELLRDGDRAAEEYRVAVQSLRELSAEETQPEASPVTADAYYRAEALTARLAAQEQLRVRAEQELLAAAQDWREKQAQAKQTAEQAQAAQRQQQDTIPRRTAQDEKIRERQALSEQMDRLHRELEENRAAWEAEQTALRERTDRAEQQLLALEQQKTPVLLPVLSLVLAVLSVLAAVLFRQPLCLLGWLPAGTVWLLRKKPDTVLQAAARTEQAQAQAAYCTAETEYHTKENERASALQRLRWTLAQQDADLQEQSRQQAEWEALDAEVQRTAAAAAQAAALEQAAAQGYARSCAAAQPMLEAAGLPEVLPKPEQLPHWLDTLRTRHEADTAARTALLARYGCDSPEALHEQYLAACANARSRALVREKEQTVQARGNALTAQLRRYRAVQTPDEAMEALRMLRAALDTISALRLEVRGAAAGLGLEGASAEDIRAERRSLETKMQGYAPDFDPAPEMLRAQWETVSRNGTAQELLALQRQLHTPEHTPAELEREMEQLGEETEAMEQYHTALELALTVMQESVEEMRSCFGPALNQATGEILSVLTGGAYEQVLVSKTYGVNVKAGTHYREHSYFSSGTVDQAYLALRLAMTRMLCAGQEPVPLLLDDVLMQYDDTRAAQCMEYFLRCGQQGTQIVLFTCHPHMVGLARQLGAHCARLHPLECTDTETK